MTKQKAYYRKLRLNHIAREKISANHNQRLALEMSASLPALESEDRQTRIVKACLDVLADAIFGGDVITVSAAPLSRLCEACLYDKPQQVAHLECEQTRFESKADYRPASRRCA